MGREPPRTEGTSHWALLDGAIICKTHVVEMHEAHRKFISQDFIYSQEEDKLYPIECNPRVHTAICLLSGNEYFSSAYLAPHSVEVAEPLAGTALKAWVGHELTAVVLPSFLPFLCLLHPLFGKRQPDPTTSQESALQLFMSDPTFALDDPLPFWVLYHLQWPVLLLKQILSGNKWSRINVSTARIFEC